MNRLWPPAAAHRSEIGGASRSASWADRGPGPWAIALLGVVAFSGVVALGSMLVSQFANVTAAAAVGRQAAGVAAVITDAVESVQRERGLAELVVADGGSGPFLEDYRDSLVGTDHTLERASRSVQAFGGTPTALTSRLQQARQQVEVAGDQTFDLYSDIIETLISQLSDLTASAPDPEGWASRSAVVRLVRAVEALGQRRGTVGMVLRSGEPTIDLHQSSRLYSTVAQREIVAAASIVTDELEPTVRALATSPKREAAAAMLEELVAGQGSDAEVVAWRSTATAQMEEVSEVAQVVERAEMERLREIERVARRNLVASAALLGVASLVSLVAAWAGYRASRERIRALREHEILVDGLREWFVNEPLPAVDGVTVESIYRAADEYTRAGGDWVEVFPLPNGQVVFGVGDVVGHGPQAVAGMVLIKSMMRGQAVEGRRSLAAGVERLDRAVTERSLVATLFYAIWSPEERSLTWLSAGHVPAILKRPDGVTMLLEGGASDALIGFDAGLPRTATDTTIPVGSTLILYTDGLVEAPGVDPAESIARLSEVEIPEAGSLDGDPLVDVLLAQRRDERDDVAILVIRW